jgi:hypothetical protein
VDGSRNNIYSITIDCHTEASDGLSFIFHGERRIRSWVDVIGKPRAYARMNDSIVRSPWRQRSRWCQSVKLDPVGFPRARKYSSFIFFSIQNNIQNWNFLKIFQMRLWFCLSFHLIPSIVDTLRCRPDIRGPGHWPITGNCGTSIWPCPELFVWIRPWQLIRHNKSFLFCYG